jgi:hypothetical protein
MKITPFIVVLTCGVAMGISMTLSCGDDNPKIVDAADGGMCNCPAAEPPISPRVKEVTMDFVIPKNTFHERRSIACLTPSEGGVVLNGGCIGNINDDILLRQSYPIALGWTCAWSNPSAVDATVTIIVHCLVPAP